MAQQAAPVAYLGDFQRMMFVTLAMVPLRRPARPAAAAAVVA